MKIINAMKTTNSPRGIKVQTELEIETAQKVLDKINFENAIIVIEKNGTLFACKIPMYNLVKGLAITGKKCKILCPLGKNQVDEFIENGELTKIGISTDLEKFYNKSYYSVSNNGQAIEYFLAQQKHCKFHHQTKMLNGKGEFLNCEVKFFSFDKTSGTPSATFESLKTIG